MQTIIHEQHPQARLNFESIIPSLAIKGYALLPGLTNWFPKLSPFCRQEAWEALQDPTVSTALHASPAQQQQFFIGDKGVIDDVPQLGVQFAQKAWKSHLTVVDGSEKIDLEAWLPHPLRDYLADCREFMALAEEYLQELLPAATHPTRLKLRIFSYKTALSERAFDVSSTPQLAMRPHVDPSVGTIIIAKSDGLLHFQHNNEWCPACRFDEKPFALLMPGIAAWHDLGIPPTPHFVLPCTTPRTSVTLFLTPRLSGHRALAGAELSRWRMAATTINH
jgi:hypothetical protein